MCKQQFLSPAQYVWLVVSTLLWQGAAYAQAVPAIPVATVQAGNAATLGELEGVVEAVRQSTVAAQTNGRITVLHVKAGDAVRAGQLLMTIDDREAQTAGQQSSAQNEQADAALRNAEQQLRRSQDLRKQGFISQAALDTAQSQYDSALAQKKQAIAARAQTGLTQSYSRVTAPFDGYVSTVVVDVGDLATPGKPLLTVYAPQPLRVVVQVPASRLGQLLQSKGLQVQVGASNTPWLQPAGKTTVPSADPVSQTTELRLPLQAADSKGLVPGQQARIRYDMTQAAAGSAAALQVPAKAVVQRGELSAVYVWTGSAFALRPVRLGGTDSDKAQVLSGLKAGDKVALDPVRAANAPTKQ